MNRNVLWIRRVQEWQASGKNANQFCQGRDFTPRRLRYWSKRIESGAPAPMAKPASSPRLMRVVRGLREERKRATEPPKADVVWMVDVGAVRVRVTPGFDPQEFSSVLAAVMRVTQGGEA
jgi:transposase